MFKNNLIKENAYEPSKPSSQSKLIQIALEAEDLSHQLLQNNLDSTQALDTAVCLEDMCVVLGKVEKPSQVDNALLQSAANTIVAGTGLNPAAVLPITTEIVDKDRTLKALLERVGDILNSYIHGISDQFDSLSNFTKSIKTQLRENRDILYQLNKRFPLPDNPKDDYPRTITVKPAMPVYFMTSSGTLETFGDFIIKFNKTVEQFALISKTNTIIGARLMQCVRDVLPSQSVNTPELLNQMVTSANQNLYKECFDSWNKIITKNAFVISSTSNALSTAMTQEMLSGLTMGIGLKANTKMDETSLDKCSDLIRSFSWIQESKVPPFTQDCEIVLTGVTNDLLRTFIIKLENFISDLDRYYTWCATAAEVAKSQCSQDIVNINTYFRVETSSALSKEKALAYRTNVENHIGDIHSIIKLITDAGVNPLKAMNDMVRTFTIALDSLPSEVPDGNYNLPKTQ